MKLNVQRIFLLVNLLLYVPVAVLLWAGLSRKDYSANQKETVIGWRQLYDDE